MKSVHHCACYLLSYSRKGSNILFRYRDMCCFKLQLTNNIPWIPIYKKLRNINTHKLLNC